MSVHNIIDRLAIFMRGIYFSSLLAANAFGTSGSATRSCGVLALPGSLQRHSYPVLTYWKNRFIARVTPHALRFGVFFDNST